MTPESATAWKVFFDGSPAAPFLVVSLFANVMQWLQGIRDRRQSRADLAQVNEDRVRIGREGIASANSMAQVLALAAAANAEPKRHRKQEVAP